MRRIEDILDQVADHQPGADLSMLEKAYVFSAAAHQGQVRQSGEPYLSHPLEVAGLLADMKIDLTTVIAGLLHDTVEDSAATIEEIEEKFGPEVTVLVDGVTKIGQMQFSSHAERQAENMRKMIVAMATDIRVILVKLADRLHNMRTLGYLSREKQVSIAQETLEIYSPLAARMNIRKIQTELEDLSLFYLEPEIYREILSNITSKRGERENYINEVRELISAKMKEFGIPCDLEGRPKHIYSIYKKMIQQDLTINQLYDITAFRIIVQDVRECFAALGVIHSIFKPIPGRFKDYISLPKANGYQSLHTAVIGPRAERMEIQIRTREMHAYAENGIAAHWHYKEGGLLTDKERQRFVWLRSLVEWQRDLSDPNEFLSSVRQGLLFEESYVYVFTPKGEVRELPRGATPVDFAYTIHTDVGNHCVGARVNGVIAPLRYQLNDGDTVDIITAKNGTPSKDWLTFVVTTKARHRVRQYFKVEERDRAISLGKELLEKEFRKESLSYSQLSREGELSRVGQAFSLLTEDDLLVAVGFGKVSPRQVVGKLRPTEEPQASLMDRMVRRIKKPTKEGIKVRGQNDVLIRFPGCCQPLPGESIIGYITQGRGVAIHARRCQSLKDADPERLVDVEWDLEKGLTYPARIQVIVQDRPGLLAEISGAVSEAKANITQASVDVTPQGRGVIEFTIQVTDKDHLRQAIQTIRRHKAVERVMRLGPKEAGATL